MTITTLIGLTDEQIDRARKDFEHEYFQLKEITRHYEARMRRRNVKRDIMRRLTFRTPSENHAQWRRRFDKLNELDKHDERDRKRWHAGMDRCIDLLTRWNKMWDELQASKETTACGR